MAMPMPPAGGTDKFAGLMQAMSKAPKAPPPNPMSDAMEGEAPASGDDFDGQLDTYTTSADPKVAKAATALREALATSPVEGQEEENEPAGPDASGSPAAAGGDNAAY